MEATNTSMIPETLAGIGKKLFAGWEYSQTIQETHDSEAKLPSLLEPQPARNPNPASEPRPVRNPTSLSEPMAIRNPSD
ncbi:hypothetical protein LCGC14_1520090 [marine sediment metagenome]|uniref:Uncharacterized protein n=1 Tax=marine sediment metagenome TaxID=412755 RepID=A0A0F9JJR1_9ZZZZ